MQYNLTWRNLLYSSSSTRCLLMPNIATAVNTLFPQYIEDTGHNTVIESSGNLVTTVLPQLYPPHLYPNLSYIPALMLDRFSLFQFHINLPQLYPTQLYPYPQFATENDIRYMRNIIRRLDESVERSKRQMSLIEFINQ